MAEHTDQTLKKLEQHDTVQKYLVHSDESAEEVIIAGVSNEYGVENHIARHASQGKRLLQIYNFGLFLTNESFWGVSQRHAN
jgi:hypothetical protein